MKLAPRTRLAPPPRRGLTLIEVLVSLAILLLALAAIGHLVDMGSDRELDGRLQTQGSRLAQSKLAEFESGAAGLESGGGTFDGDDAGWNWTADVQPQSSPPNLYLVNVEVSRELKGRTVTVSMSQMIFDPAMMGLATEATRPDSESGGMP